MPGKFDGNLSSYDDTFLTCRTNGHAWVGEHWVPVKTEGKRAVAWDRYMSCAVCPATKVTEYTPNLAVIKTKIAYPPGYLVTAGNKFTPQEARRERITRTVGKPRLGVVR